MIGITKDKLFQKRLEKITGLKIINHKKGKHFIENNKNNKILVSLIISFIILAITNGILVYNFIKILSKI